MSSSHGRFFVGVCGGRVHCLLVVLLGPSKGVPHPVFSSGSVPKAVNGCIETCEVVLFGFLGELFQAILPVPVPQPLWAGPPWGEEGW